MHYFLTIFMFFSTTKLWAEQNIIPQEEVPVYFSNAALASNLALTVGTTGEDEDDPIEVFFPLKDAATIDHVIVNDTSTVPEWGTSTSGYLIFKVLVTTDSTSNNYLYLAGYDGDDYKIIQNFQGPAFHAQIGANQTKAEIDIILQLKTLCDQVGIGNCPATDVAKKRNQTLLIFI